MKKSNKKGFTIVELVIVIAVIAILAAVLIPTFKSVIKKAQQSSDIQAVRNMNTALIVEQIENKPETIEEVAAILAEANFNLPRNPLVSGYEFYWISTENVVVLYNTETDKVEFPEEYKDATYNEETWFSLDWEPVTVVEIHTADELYGYLHDPNTTGKAKLVANVSSDGITDEDAKHFVVVGTKDLDLNGYTISGKGGSYTDESSDAKAVIFVSASGDLVINDSAGTGTVEPSNGQITTYAVYNYGKLTIKGGKYVGGSMIFEDVDVYVCYDAVAGSDGNTEKTIIDGGTFVNKYPTQSDTDSNNAVVRCTINGGLFNHKPNLIATETDDTSCKVKEGFTISTEPDTDGYYYLVEE